jgi:hypothetical protein
MNFVITKEIVSTQKNVLYDVHTTCLSEKTWRFCCLSINVNATDLTEVSKRNTPS